MPSNDERLATLEEHRSNTDKFMTEFASYMHEGRLWREETSKCLAVVVSNQNGMNTYQVKCDSERSSIIKANIDLDKRVTATEGFQGRQLKWVGAIALAVSYIGTHGKSIYDGLKAFFTS